METIEAILSRRSIRRYTQQPVAENLVKELLEAAMSAPSADNEQPWQFVVINDRALLDAIPNYHKYAFMAREAPLAVLVCGDSKLLVYQDLWVQACAAATENMLLAATSKGLGAVWCSVYPDKERMQSFSQHFHLPDNIIPFAIVPIGYPAEHKGKVERYLSSRVHWNRWH
jgi:nitroreductase